MNENARPGAAVDLQALWSEVALPDALEARILGDVARFNAGDPAARGLLIFGAPGTGKTEIIRRIAVSAGAEHMRISVQDLAGTLTGHSEAAVRQIWQQARAAGRCVMHIDWFEGAFPCAGSNHADEFSSERVEAFLREWDVTTADRSHGIWVIGESHQPDLVHPAVRSRLAGSYEIPLPDERGRALLLLGALVKLLEDCEFDVAATAAELARRTEGRSGRVLLLGVARARETAAAAGRPQLRAQDLFDAFRS